MTPSRDLSTILCRLRCFSVILDPRNLLAGFRLDPGAITVHVTVFGLRWEWRKPDGSGQPRTDADADGYLHEWMPGEWHA